jgi:hypothetical protein
MLVNLLNQLPLIFRDIVQHTQSTKRRSQDKSDASVAHDVGGESSRPGLQTSVCDLLEAHASNVVGGCLFGIANIPVHMVVALIGRHLCLCGGRRRCLAGWCEGSWCHDR